MITSTYAHTHTYTKQQPSLGWSPPGFQPSPGRDLASDLSLVPIPGTPGVGNVAWKKATKHTVKNDVKYVNKPKLLDIQKNDPLIALNNCWNCRSRGSWSITAARHTGTLRGQPAIPISRGYWNENIHSPQISTMSWWNVVPATWHRDLSFSFLPFKKTMPSSLCLFFLSSPPLLYSILFVNPCFSECSHLRFSANHLKSWHVLAFHQSNYSLW